MVAGRDYIALVRRWLWLVLLAALISGVAAYIVSRAIRPTYEAEAKLLVNAKQAPNALTYNDVLLSQQLTKTYSNMAVDSVVLLQVLQQGNLPYTLDEFSKMISAQPVQDTQLIVVTARAHQAMEAQLIASQVAQTFISQQRARLESGASSDIISVVQPALVPAKPVSPRVALNTAFGVFLGGNIAIGVIALLTFLDDTVKTQRDVETSLQLPVLGLIPFGDEEADRTGDTKGKKPRGRSAEAFRMVRTNLDFATANNGARSILVTSTQKGEGKTTTACKLAVTIAETGKQVVLLDADLRFPRVHRVFNVDNRVGLTNFLITPNANVQDFLQASPIPTLYLLTSGVIPPNPADLLQGEHMSVLLSNLLEVTDVVIIDSPPALAVADAVILASKVQGILFVTASGSTRLTRIGEALTMLRRSNAPVLGVVLNKVSRNVDSYYSDASYTAYVSGATEHAV